MKYTSNHTGGSDGNTKAKTEKDEGKTDDFLDLKTGLWEGLAVYLLGNLSVAFVTRKRDNVDATTETLTATQEVRVKGSTGVSQPANGSGLGATQVMPVRMYGKE